MPTQTDWTDADSQKALQIWEEYQKAHDVSALKGKAVGIDPKSGQVFFGDSASDVAAQARAVDADSHLLCLRVGFGYYARKGGGRR